MVRVLDLESGGRRLESRIDRLAGVVSRWTLRFAVIIKITNCLPPVGIFNLLWLVVMFFSFSLSGISVNCKQ